LLGSSVSHVDDYLLPLVAVIVALSLLPLLAEARRTRRDRRNQDRPRGG
ncbi:DedA family protein, partial [Streptomyces sp. SAS_269]